jgi:6,7-dimethyl-8-ribityllumazine synthase
MTEINVAKQPLHHKDFTQTKVAVVISDFNEEVTSKLKEGCLAELKKYLAPEHIYVVHVPGAIEIPLVLKALAEKKQCNALIALGAVIRGETSHYDYVCEQVSQGCQQVMLDYDLPVIFGVLTTENDEQAFDRVGGAHGHKGVDSAIAALQMVLTLQRCYFTA